MSEKLKESLSAVVDGEADEFELRRVLDEIGKNELLAASWERYHVIGSVIRRERSQASAGMRERIWAELRTGQEGQLPATGGHPLAGDGQPAAAPTARRWAPLAAAASVAAVVAIGIVGYGQLEEDPPAFVAESEATIGAQQGALYQAAALKAEVTDSDQSRTDAYIVRHYQQIGMDRPGLGFVRMVAYERD